MINDGHNLIVDSELHGRMDPVFGPEVEKRFGRLFDSIQETLSASHM